MGQAVTARGPARATPVGSRDVAGTSAPQGLNWYRERLREDRDGDTADEFLVEPTTTAAQPRMQDPPRAAQPSAPAAAPAAAQPRNDPALEVRVGIAERTMLHHCCDVGIRSGPPFLVGLPGSAPSFEM